MLTSFTVERFKSYQQEATLHLAPLTVLIGANASGKSNVVEALRLLSWIAHGNKLGAISHTVQGDNQAIRGGMKDLAFRRKRMFQLSCSTSHPQWNRYSVCLARAGDDELRIADEWLTGADQTTPLFQIAEVADGRTKVGDVRVAYNNFARGGRKPHVTCHNQMSMLAQLQSPGTFAKHHRESRRTIPAVASQYLSWMSNIVFLDPRPSRMRGYSFKTDGELDSSGANLSGVLYGLCRKGGRKQRILDLVKALPEQDINKIGFIETPRNEAMVTLTETFGGRQTAYDATLLSDGTLRVLAIGAALLTAPKGSLVVIEEIDNGVHPSRAGVLIEQILEIAKDRDLNWSSDGCFSENTASPDIRQSDSFSPRHATGSATRSKQRRISASIPGIDRSFRNLASRPILGLPFRGFRPVSPQTDQKSARNYFSALRQPMPHAVPRISGNSWP